MPNYYAHRIFGARVLEGLGADLRTALEGERPAFDLGCLGPDPLFFHRIYLPNAARRAGFRTHDASALSAFQRLRPALEAGVPTAAGYAAGLLCHLALDSACHGWVRERVARGDLTHLGMEGELDRRLMAAHGLDPLRSHMPPPPGEEAFQAAALAYEHVSPGQMGRAYRSMARYTRLLARLSGTALGRGCDRLCGCLPGLKGLQDVILSGKEREQYTESSRILGRMLEKAVPTAVEQLGRFFAAVAGGTALDPWLDRDFEGGAPGGLSELREIEGPGIV